MPALKPVRPSLFRRLLETAGYHLIAEDSFNWVFARRVDDFPVVVPYGVSLLPVDVMMSILDRAGIDDGVYFQMIDQASPSESAGADEPFEA